MKQALLIIAILLLLMGGGYILFGPQTTSNGDLAAEKVNLPWNVTQLDDGSSIIFDVHLETSTLNGIMQKWGRPEKMALFTSKGTPLSVEVFFKNPPIGPMKASIVLTLETTEQEMLDIGMNTTGQSGTETGDARHTIAQDDQKRLLNHTITTLTYVPSYKGLEAEYFEERLGKPVATHRESETAISWFYPNIGLTLLIDDSGKDVFQYESPNHFELPKEALSRAVLP